MGDIKQRREALGDFARQYGLTSIVFDDGTVVEAPMPRPDLKPLSGYGDTVERGDLVRIYFKRSGRPERLEFDGVHVNDFDDDEDSPSPWVNILTEDGDITSFSCGGLRSDFYRRFELIEPEI